jgi:formylglycine-generating enzyme required for sulfatase activity
MRLRSVAVPGIVLMLVAASAQADQDDDPFSTSPELEALPELAKLPDLPALPELPPLGEQTPTPVPPPAATPKPPPTATPKPTPSPTLTPTPSPAPTSVDVPAAKGVTLGQYDEYRRDVGAFSLDTDPVTRAQYERCVDAGKCAALTCSGIPDARATCVDLSAAQSYCAFAGGRLPTEDEWERAAREATRLGVHGTRDGVYEWTASPYCYFCGRDEQVVRGGPTGNPSLRAWREPGTSQSGIGFRCAR